MQPDLSSPPTDYLAYAAPLLGYVLIRAFAVRAALRFMNQRADTSFTAEYAARTKPEEQAPLASHGAPPPVEPTFRVIDVTDRVKVDDVSERLVSRARWSSIKALGLFVLAMLVYLGVQAYGMKGMQMPGGGGLVALIVAAGLTFGVFALLLYLFGSEQLLDPRWLLVLGVLLPTLSILLHTTLDASLGMGLLASGLAIALVAQWFVRQRRSQAAHGNLELLVLRVFNTDRNTVSVFGPLMSAWKYLGTHFTVADPSYIRYQLSLSSGRGYMLLMRAFLAMSLLAAAVYGLTSLAMTSQTWRSLDPMLQKRVVTSLLWFLVIPLAMLGAMRSVRRRFITTPDALRQKLRKATGARSWTAETFPAAPLFCPDNVWRSAVHAMFGVSKVVLMDLRGFTPERRGCEYEIGALIDRVRVSRMLFLVDDGPSREAVQEIIRERWAAMRADSPNRLNPAPEIVMYRSTPGDPRDVPQLLRLLLLGARSDATPTPSLVSLEPMRPRWAITRLLARVSLFLATLSERLSTGLDMLVARPAASWATAAALLLFAIVPLGRDVRAAMANPAAIAAPNDADSNPFAGDTISDEASVTPARELPELEGVTSRYTAGEFCNSSRGVGTSEELALVAVTFEGAVLRTARARLAPELDPVIDAAGRRIGRDDFFDSTDQWKELHQIEWPEGRVADSSRVCLDLVFAQPPGVFPTTVDITGRLPLRLTERTRTAPMGNMKAADSMALDLDSVTTATLRRNGEALTVTIRGTGRKPWSAELVDARTRERQPLVGLSYENDAKVGIYSPENGYRGTEVVFTHWVDRRVSFSLRGVRLTKCTTCGE